MYKLETRTAQAVVGAAGGIIAAANDVVAVDVSDLDNVSAFIVQVNDAGTVVLRLDKTPDQTIMTAVGATVAETDFAAGANKAVTRELSDANGMPTPVRELRLTATALAGGGTYKLVVQGRKRIGYGS
jgi:hypothetical protein